jgi:two-component system chemotaxis sensor kinase CheA
MKLDAVKQTFIVESSELLNDMESGLLILEKQPDDHDSINAVFRAAHTIKGSSGMFGYTGIVEFTHVLENFLEKLRQGKFTVTSDMTAILLACRDHLSELIGLYTGSDNFIQDDNMKKKGQKLLNDLAQIQPGMVIQAEEEKKPEEKTVVIQSVSKDSVKNENWHISMRFHHDVFRHGLDPASFINYLSETGEIKNVVTLSDQVPSLDSIDPEKCYLGFEISLKSDSGRDEISSVFEFIADDSIITIIEPHGEISLYNNLLESIDENRDRMIEVFREMEVFNDDEVKKIRNFQKELIMAENVKEKVAVLEKTPEIFENIKSDISQPAEDRSRAVIDTAARFIRIEAKKLDSLINLVGELVINVANIRQLSENNGDKAIIEASLTMSRLVEEVRDSAMNIRMVQIGETLKKFERVVRDLSKNMGKQIELKITGSETELDKTVVEKINDPLMHLIRNSIDHGITTPEERIKAGKNPVGTIEVNAFHETGNIVIEISDDGEGLNKEKILNKARENKIAKPGVEYSDEEIYSFIFEAGLSTAGKVTDVSGRGVGMDVVRRNVEALRGNIDIRSEAGKGTTMKISLPLTLAIIDGFLVEIGKVSYVIPLDMVLECINISDEDAISKESGNFVNLRGEVLPYLRMRDFFNVDFSELGESEENIIVVRYGAHKAGLMVDRLIGEYQTVIKSLGRMFLNLHGISGATILGNGEVALILDIPRLIKHAQDMETSGMKKKE